MLLVLERVDEFRLRCSFAPFQTALEPHLEEPQVMNQIPFETLLVETTVKARIPIVEYIVTANTYRI